MAMMETPLYLQQCRQLNEHDLEYGKIVYLIKLGLRSTSVDIVSIHMINSPANNARWEHANQNSTILDSFLNSRELSENNSTQNVIARGGRVAFTPEEPQVLFSTGNIRLPAEIRDQSPGGNRAARQVHEFLYCRIAVGHALVLERSKLHSQAQGLPAGFDSIKIYQTEEEDAIEEPSPDFYYHEYMLGDESKVLPLFVVRFLFDPEADKLKKNPLCEICDRKPASLYCLQDNARFCDQCDAEVHTGKVFGRHSRVAIGEVTGQLTLTRCKEHPEMPVQFFDITTFQPVCVHCKMVGSHSTGENASHPLIPINEAYKQNMVILGRESEAVETKQNRITQQLTRIEERLNDIHDNATTVEKQVRAILDKIISRLHESTQSKLHYLLSDEAELKRQFHYFQWLESFLSYQREVINPVEFLTSFKYHSSLLQAVPSELLETSPIVLENLCLEGNLDILATNLPGVGPPVQVLTAPPQRPPSHHHSHHHGHQGASSSTPGAPSGGYAGSEY
eukprot:TRINITY_DN49012_c0_g2_i1.p1 TRINITY_DN49012_c0_g2~~TRINITY_DN49012_c0_g2_i1.p1  ORF type:complete len:507 (+),score=25.73 TRINITY_DN49012_c0_g2_i1:74-1594(+)